METYEVGSPWITWSYLNSDKWTRLTGRSRIRGTCSICGHREILTIRIPRFGPVPVPEGGRHPLRVTFVDAHQHTAEQRENRLLWALPLRNLCAA